MAGHQDGTITPPEISDAYCRVAFFDARRRLLTRDADVKFQHLDWDAQQFGVIDPATGVLILAIDRNSGKGVSGPHEAVFMAAVFDDEILRARVQEIGISYGLTPRQTSFLKALIDAGGIREAAAATNLAYTAARNTLAEIKAKTGFKALAPLVGHMLELISGTQGTAHDAIDRHDLFGLSDRQFAIACGIGSASDRRELADRLGISEAVLKAELKDLYLILGVRNAGQLARMAIEARLSITSLVTDAHHEWSPNILPEERITDESGRTISWSDFGPAGGRPVFILHSTITARAPPMRLVAALREAGFRPIALDRPGFGGTSSAEGDFDLVAARDFARVCAHLSIAKADLVARGSGQAAVMLAQYEGQLIERAVLVNPTPHIDFTSVDRGPLGAVKRRFVKNPMVAEGMIRLLAAFATPRRMREGMLRSFRGSAPDEAVIDDPQFVADYFRAVRGFAEGHITGYVAEQTAWGRGQDVPAMPGMKHWRILQGAHFVLHDPQQALIYWQSVLPDTPVTMVPEAGQMLAYSHPLSIVAALSA